MNLTGTVPRFSCGWSRLPSGQSSERYASFPPSKHTVDIPSILVFLVHINILQVENRCLRWGLKVILVCFILRMGLVRYSVLPRTHNPSTWVRRILKHRTVPSLKDVAYESCVKWQYANHSYHRKLESFTLRLKDYSSQVGYILGSLLSRGGDKLNFSIK